MRVTEGQGGGELVALLGRSNLRLLFGMVRANRPWRFALRLYRALVAALGTAAFTLVTDNVWGIAAALGSWRLGVITILSIAATTASLIAVHDLWEHRAPPRARVQVALFNATTTVTVTIGVMALYIELVIFSLLAALLLIAPQLLARSMGTAGVSDYLQLSLLAGALATVGGALGGNLESDRTVKEAAYAIRPNGHEPAAPARRGPSRG